MGIIDELKTVGKVLQEAGRVEQYQQILDAQQKMLDMQERIAELERKNRSLKEKLAIEDSLIFEQNAYWIERGEGRDGPFCSKCKDSDNKLVRVREGNYFGGWAHCPNCNQVTPGSRV